MDAACKLLREQCSSITAPTALATGDGAQLGQGGIMQTVCEYVDGAMCGAAKPTQTTTKNEDWRKMDAACKVLREQCSAITAPTALATGAVGAQLGQGGIAPYMQTVCEYVDGAMCGAAKPTHTTTQTPGPTQAPSSGSGWLILVALAIAVVVLSK